LHTRTKAIELQHTKENKEELELVLKQVKLETKDKKDRMEQGVVVAYDRIPKNVQIKEATTTHKIDHIVQKIDQYRQEI
jgi:hypothetical protein